MLREGCKLRVKDFNFDTGMLSVRGKGEKTRTVPIPERLVPELLAQLESAMILHDEDLKAGFAGVFLDDQLEKKYPKAAKDLVWQPRDFASQASAKAGCTVVRGRSLMSFGAVGSC